MNLLCSILKECLHIVFQLRTTHDGVVAEHHALILQQRGIRYQLHLCHQCTPLLIAGCKRARPRRRIFQNRPLIRHTLSFGIAQGHTHTRVGHATNTVYLGIVSLTHLLSVSLAHCLHVNTIIVRGRETVVNP